MGQYSGLPLVCHLSICLESLINPKYRLILARSSRNQKGLARREIPNYKPQITNKFKIQRFGIQNKNRLPRCFVARVAALNLFRV